MNFPSTDLTTTSSQPSSLFLEVADAVGVRLCREAVWSGSRCNWLGASMEVIGSQWKVVQRTFGPDPYGGTSGIALFLGQLYGFVDERIFRMTALAAMQHALSRLEDISPIARVSFYSGVSGVAYICNRLARLLDEPQLAQQALNLLSALIDTVLDAQGVDLLNGSAGAIPTLLYLGQEHRRQDLLDRAVRYGERLLTAAHRSSYGWSWHTMSTPNESQQPEVPDLLGFSHGASGIAWSLLELYQETKDERFREGTEQAFLYERHWFDSQHQNWPDFRSLHEGNGASEREPGFMIAWCHGAPGIGLARLRAYQALGDLLYRQEAETALQTTAQALEQSLASSRASFCLCHGLAGNADVLLYANQVFHDLIYRDLAERVGRYGADLYHAARAPWPCGVMGGGETPGLFLGLAGIGYFYLRLHQPDSVPPITIPLPFDPTSMAAPGQ